MLKKKNIYFNFFGSPFKKGEVLAINFKSKKFIVIEANCKDQWWRKFLRKLGFKIKNIEGLTKCKIYKK